MDLSMDVALEKRVAAAVEAAISRVETNRLMPAPATRTNRRRTSTQVSDLQLSVVDAANTGGAVAASNMGDDDPWWMPLPPQRLVDLLWRPYDHAAATAPHSEVMRARSEAATWAAAVVYLGYLATRK